MKPFFTLLFAACLASSFTTQTGLQEVISALQNNNASQMARYFDNTIDITTPQKTNSYSKNQGEAVLKDFLATNPVKSFQVLHKGDNAGSKYCIGKLTTRNGSYRT
ncbi:MAG: DUF4783 domain-containing protein, partial [Chitinophagaceae bacterium]